MADTPQAPIDDMARRSFRTQERDKAVASCLTMIAAPSQDEAADVYMPPRLHKELCGAHHAGLRHRGTKLSHLRELQHLMAAAFGLPKPGPDVRHELAAGHASRICRTVLAMSDPPPARHVAYLTTQLRRAFAAAWEAGADDTDREIEAAKRDLRAAAQAVTLTKPEHHALIRRVNKETSS